MPLPARSTKIRRELGWAPLVPFETGLAETVAWYAANEEWWRPLIGDRRLFEGTLGANDADDDDDADG